MHQDLEEEKEIEEVIVGRDVTDILEQLSEDNDEDSYSEEMSSADALSEFQLQGKREIVEKDAYSFIRQWCKELGIRVREPNPKCKHCHGRGYTAFNAKPRYPLPCNCIFFPEDINRLENRNLARSLSNNGPNRAQRRADEKYFRRLKKSRGIK